MSDPERTIYLAGPVSLNGTCTPDEVALFTSRFTQAAERLRGEGFTVLNPTELDARPTWADYMRATIPMVCAADEVVVLPLWRKSRGALIEVGIAENLGIPVREYAPNPPLPPESSREA